MISQRIEGPNFPIKKKFVKILHICAEKKNHFTLNQDIQLFRCNFFFYLQVLKLIQIKIDVIENVRINCA